MGGKTPETQHTMVVNTCHTKQYYGIIYLSDEVKVTDVALFSSQDFEDGSLSLFDDLRALRTRVFLIW